MRQLKDRVGYTAEEKETARNRGRGERRRNRVEGEQGGRNISTRIAYNRRQYLTCVLISIGTNSYCVVSLNHFASTVICSLLRGHILERPSKGSKCRGTKEGEMEEKTDGGSDEETEEESGETETGIY